MKEKRRFTRFDKRLGVIYSTLGVANVGASVVTSNVSRGGVKIPISRLIKKGDRLKLEIDAPDKKYPPIQAIGRVAWTREIGRFDIDSGIQFIRISPYDSNRLIT